eukprot:COSAG02_NODE_4715_length_5063_cov_2.229452_2_plen_219_part_00
MMQFASEGQWGRGLYFAEDAGYSHFYASPADPRQNDLVADEREMMLCDIVLGNVIVMDRDEVGRMKQRLGGRLNGAQHGSSIKAPPFINSTPPLHTDGNGPKYNTVSGFTQTDMKHPNGKWTKHPDCPRSQVYVIYENGRAYPHYLVRYYRGPYDPRRVLYRSREEAIAASSSSVSDVRSVVPDSPSVFHSYCHIGPDGSENEYPTADCEAIHTARMS